MEQRELSRTIEKFFSKAPNLENTEELLTYAVQKMINSDEISITGGRIWKLNDKKNSYILLKQLGDVKVIDNNYELKVKYFPVFKEIGIRRTIMSTETDKYLKTKGIYHYSATGVGTRYKFNRRGEKYSLYQYLLAFNANMINDEFIYTLNIISTTINSILRTRKIENRAKENIVELEKASEIQRNILPDHSVNFGNYEIFGLSVPDKLVGGDFFDYIFSSDENKLCIAIADAASKGISAAAQALYVSGALKMGVEYVVNSTSLVGKINNLVNETFPNERFVTLFLCELYKDTKGLCTYINAGHNLPYHLKYSDKKIETLSTTGPVLGPAPGQTFFSDSLYIELDDILLLYTDGIIEAMNNNYSLYGEERLKRLLLSSIKLSPKEICYKIIEDVQKYSSKGKYSDDKTLVVIKRIK